MDGKLFNIGLDFGTHQSKACVLDTTANPQQHEFIRFVDLRGNPTYFLPTRLFLKSNGTIDYGYTKETENVRSFSFFKIASAEDEHFRVVTGLEEHAHIYDRNEFHGYSPEFISVLYITYIQLYVKGVIRSRSEQKKQKGFIARFGSKTSGPELIFSTQMGIPTEYSELVNLFRRRKFENILMLSEILQQGFGSLDNFTSTRINDLQSMVAESYDMLSKGIDNLDEYKSNLNKHRISVFPETAAGLTFLMKTRRLAEGYYSALDIGGGSSDLSYFYVTADNRIKYLASESFIMAANDVFRAYINKSDVSFAEIQNAEKEVIELFENNVWENQKRYTDSVEQVMEKVYKRMYDIFNIRVYWYFERFKGLPQYDGQPCFVYGGGAKLKKYSKLDQIKIHDHGQSALLTSVTNLKLTQIDQYVPKVGILPDDRSWLTDFVMLVVAYGLSFPHQDTEASWEKDLYRDYRNQETMPREEVPHPFNEGYFIYNILESRWAIS